MNLHCHLCCRAEATERTEGEEEEGETSQDGETERYAYLGLALISREIQH